MAPERTPAALAAQLAALSGMTTSQLAERFESLAGHRPHSRNPSYLRRRVAWLLQSEAYGEKLSDAARARAHEIAKLSDLRLTAPTPRADRTVKRKLGVTRDARLPPVGTVLTRTYRGREIRALVLDHGFEFEGTIYRSLSAIASTVTGTHCSGPAWFGLAKRGSR